MGPLALACRYLFVLTSSKSYKRYVPIDMFRGCCPSACRWSNLPLCIKIVGIWIHQIQTKKTVILIVWIIKLGQYSNKDFWKRNFFPKLLEKILINSDSYFNDQCNMRLFDFQCARSNVHARRILHAKCLAEKSYRI